MTRALWVAIAVLGVVVAVVAVATSSGSCATASGDCSVSSIGTDPVRWVVAGLPALVVAYAVYQIVRTGATKRRG